MDRTEQQVIDEINALLGEMNKEYDPANPGINPAWNARRTAPPPPPGSKDVSTPPICATTTKGHKRIPAVGHIHGRVIQPSDARNRAKMEWLTNPPEARPRSKKPPPKQEAPRPTRNQTGWSDRSQHHQSRLRWNRCTRYTYHTLRCTQLANGKLCGAVVLICGGARSALTAQTRELAWCGV